jgi:hypothetical protein
MVSEVPVHGHLASLLQVCGEAENHGAEDIMEQSCSLHGGQEAERKTGKNQGRTYSPRTCPPSDLLPPARLQPRTLTF